MRSTNWVWMRATMKSSSTTSTATSSAHPPPTSCRSLACTRGSRASKTAPPSPRGTDGDRAAPTFADDLHQREPDTPSLRGRSPWSSSRAGRSRRPGRPGRPARCRRPRRARSSPVEAQVDLDRRRRPTDTDASTALSTRLPSTVPTSVDGLGVEPRQVAVGAEAQVDAALGGQAGLGDQQGRDGRVLDVGRAPRRRSRRGAGSGCRRAATPRRTPPAAPGRRWCAAGCGTRGSARAGCW